MAKFKVNYTEVFNRTFIVEAGTKEEAQEKMEYAAEHVSGLITDRNFDFWDVEVEREANRDDLERYDDLPEE